MELSPDGGGLRPRSRFARFTNLPELQQMFHAFSDVQTAEMLNLLVPRLQGGKATVVACPMSEEQCELQEELVRRYERIRSQKIDPREDNALAITTDGRKLATDARMLSAAAPDFPGSKINRLVENVAELWKQTAAPRSTQMIFSDIGVHPTAWGYSPYAEIIEKLTARGIPRDQIAAIGEAESDAKKQSLFEKVRNGSVRVLIGSTQKMGTGTNVQNRLVALHHLDAPWKPAEVEQRDGRILRQGNDNEEVAIYRYVTEGSFDAYMWQALETKAKFIGQVMSGDNRARRAGDIGGQELSYAEVKAITSGNPAVLTLAEADAELQRLALLRKNHLDEQYVARRSVRDLPATISFLSERLSALDADRTSTSAHANDPIEIAGRKPSPDDVLTLLGKQLETLPQRVREPTRIPLGTYRGLRFGIELYPQFPAEVFLEGEANRHSALSREHQGPRTVLNALQRIITNYGNDCAKLRQDLAIAESQLRDYQVRLGQPFPHEAYLSELGNLRDRLKTGLSGGASPENESVNVSELTEQIEALRTENTIEATAPRVRHSRDLAVEPVTTRIHRRRASAGIVEPDARVLESDYDQVALNDFPVGKRMTFHERMQTESSRQINVAGPS
ncbi:MAG: helicase [Schlesneria sp.]|nr:helicase [Schlesneria sp.]